jgi:proline iminopeptidase
MPVGESLYPEVAPYDQGMLDVGGGDLMYWESCGNPTGKAALVLHGGPGSGCTSWQPRLFNPEVHRIVLFDQRNCGRSTPNASAPGIDLGNNTTPNLLADIERLRTHLGVERWMVIGGSWGSALALAYAERHPDRVTTMVLWGANSARRSEFDWLFRGGVGAFFPEQWERLLNAVPEELRGIDVVDAYKRMLFDADPEIRANAAYEWCMWESTTPSWPPTSDLDERFEDPTFALAFARIVTHYVHHDARSSPSTRQRSVNTAPGNACA